MKFLFLIPTCLIALYVLIKRPLLASKSTDPPSQQVSSETLKQYVRTISESFQPRNSDHPDNLNTASEYIQKKLTAFNADTDFQPFQVGDIEYRNVISNFGPDTREVIIVGAHYDAYSVHPGADDSASGVAGLLELGRLLSRTKLSKRVILVAYTLEEPPFFRSEYMGSFVHAASLKDKQVRLMICLEMVGYFSDEDKSQTFPSPLLKLLYPETGNYIAVVDRLFSNQAAGLKASINRYTALTAYSINAPPFVPGIDLSDHRNYWDHGMPAVMVTDTAFYRNFEYHEPGDTYDRLDYDKMAMVVYGVFKHVEKLAGTN